MGRMSELHTQIVDALDDGLSYSKIADLIVQDYGVSRADALKWVQQVAKEWEVYDDEGWDSNDDPGYLDSDTHLGSLD